METPFNRLPASEYDGDSRHGTISTTLEKLESLFGRARYHTDGDFPDDDYKCSVCFGLQREGGKKIGIWSYKYWHYEGEPINPKEVISFSTSATGDDLQLIQQLATVVGSKPDPT